MTWLKLAAPPSLNARDPAGPPCGIGATPSEFSLAPVTCPPKWVNLSVRAPAALAEEVGLRLLEGFPMPW